MPLDAVITIPWHIYEILLKFQISWFFLKTHIFCKNGGYEMIYQKSWNLKFKQNLTKVSWNSDHGIYKHLWDVKNAISNFLLIFCIFRAFLQPKRPISKFQKNHKNRDFRQNLTFPTNERYGSICIYMDKIGLWDPLNTFLHHLGHFFQKMKILDFSGQNSKILIDLAQNLAISAGFRPKNIKISFFMIISPSK